MENSLLKQNDSHEEGVKNKFIAWWNGHEAEGSNESSLVQTEQNMENTLRKVSTNYINMLERIWGKGFLEPGYIDFNKKIFGLFTLNNSKTVLDVSCGLGGVSQNLSLEYEVWVDAFEENQILREEAFKNIASTKANSRIKIQPIDYADTFTFAAEKYHYAYSRDRLFTIQNKEQLFKEIHNALKKKGEFTFTDYILNKDIPMSDVDIENLSEAEDMPIYLYTQSQYEELATEVNMEMRNTKDYSAEYIELITLGWKKLEKELSAKDIKKELYPYILNEMEIWLYRYNALVNKKIKYVQILCQKKSD